MNRSLYRTRIKFCGMRRVGNRRRRRRGWVEVQAVLLRGW